MHAQTEGVSSCKLLSSFILLLCLLFVRRLLLTLFLVLCSGKHLDEERSDWLKGLGWAAPDVEGGTLLASLRGRRCG